MDSIGSFAESLILEDLENIGQGKKSSFGGAGGVAAESDMPDISNIDINSNQVQALLSGRNISSEVALIQEDIQEYSEEPQAQAQDPISILVEQLSYLVEKAESLVTRLDEMTQTVGMGGTNQKFNLMQSEPFTPPPALKVMNKVKKLRKYRRR